MIEHLFAARAGDIGTSYLAGPTLYVGRPELIRARALLATAAASQLGQVVLKWQGTIDLANADGWGDLASTRDEGGVLELEHAYPAPPGSRAVHSFTLDVRGLLAVRVLARASGGSGQAGDEILVDGATW